MIEVGDVVVCVDARPRRHRDPGTLATLAQLEERKFYRVLNKTSWGSEFGVHVEGVAMTRGDWLNSCRFRKVEAPSTEIADMIRAARPANVTTTA